jgi:hypothetical protein
MEAIRSSETSVLTRATRRKIPAGIILLSLRLEKSKYYKNFGAFVFNEGLRVEELCYLKYFLV